jgi:excinuclease UvrABC helicase subunit UvrB
VNLKLKIETGRSELLTGLLDNHKVLKSYIKKQETYINKQEECNKKIDKIEAKTTNQYNNVLLVQSQTSDQFATELTKLTVQCDRHSAQNLQNCIQLNECINICKGV